jgi:hypothetical protein
MDKKHPCRLLHRLHEDLCLGRHGRIGKLKRVKVENGVQDAGGCAWSRSDENREGVQGGIDKQSIAVMAVVSISAALGVAE